MFPKLSDIINYILGTSIEFPIQTYGFFLALAFLIAGLVLSIELNRKEKEGLLPNRLIQRKAHQTVSVWQILIGTLLSSIIAWKFFGILMYYADFAANPQQFLISGKGSVKAFFIVVIISLAYNSFYNYRAKKKSHEILEETIHPYQYTWNILMVGLVFALIGSKLFDLIDNFDAFLKNPIKSIVSFSGLTFYGGFIVTVIALMLYMRVIKLNWKHVIDATAPAIMIGYAVGRLGCHFSGDGCWGIENTLTAPTWIPQWLWASNYPGNVINAGIPIPGCHGDHCLALGTPVFPTSLYESLMAILAFSLLWLLRKHMKAPVTLFGVFLILNGTSRFLIEKIRVNHKYNILGLHLTQAEIISFILLVLGIAVILYFKKTYQKNAEQIKNITNP